MYKYFGQQEALKNINLTFHNGETTVILGPSGSGKSTLLRCINLLENVIEGRLTVLKEKQINAVEKGKLLLEKVGLSQKIDSYPAQLSGGQQQRVAIARALAMEPQFLLFDEPTSALDPELEGEVLKVLKDLSEEEKSMIIVTHNLNFAREVADRILFLEHGEIVFDGATAQFFEKNDNARIQSFIQSMQFI